MFRPIQTLYKELFQQHRVVIVLIRPEEGNSPEVAVLLKAECLWEPPAMHPPSSAQM